MKANEIIQCFEEWAPGYLAYEWDNSGLQIGSLDKEVSKVMVTLDVLENVVDEAIEKRIDFILAHHPMLFSSIKSIDFQSPKGRLIQKLIKHDITVYAAHTNLDVAANGVSEMLAKELDVENTEILFPSEQETLLKLVVYVPNTHVEKVKQALGESGAGHIGNYSDCMFETKGEGQFKPLEGTSPFLGEQGKVERVEETKIETILPANRLRSIIKSLHDAHPYEEVAYDIYRLENQGMKYGAGRIGDLRKEMTLESFSQFIKERLDVPFVRVTGDLKQPIRRVAILGGSGKDFIEEVSKTDADVYVTGDMSFHEAQDALELGLSLIDPGHHVEKVMKQAVKEYFETRITEGVSFLISEANTEPFQFL
ncbi:Nif3-like dinuclear metal center hexameric protein [Radiobacillus kanasensis]|uniref:Nif3-like dinuclear metal center hexameric protein n=1 Tax=Radiobacillus kanasensis TaxID=2844358 RepID=UPI001E29B102|nr:Nif3-like dinuclear metal center hexameric protein [Radiobacillus kanasensis]UFT97801.1 Nif3-like dinuclear metal center hexameric protein [Radiobacillus kanasensis]